MAQHSILSDSINLSRLQPETLTTDCSLLPLLSASLLRLCIKSSLADEQGTQQEGPRKGNVSTNNILPSSALLPFLGGRVLLK